MKVAYISAALFAALAAAVPQRVTISDSASTRREALRPTTSVKITTRPSKTTRTTTRATTTSCTLTLCADGVNECSMMYGGCFPACPGLPTPTFTPPPCPTPKKCDQQLCVDNVNECGMMYGGCFEACPWSPQPTFVPPPCPSGWNKGKPGNKPQPVNM
ncbi:hypothetical protein H072_6711 [Dactylellina haptotyla CBS 200.50]|uniref:WAP domain-containing protein n=1 Tax=Dactylellina haptotyla (strain CBS 200.50) TaxID=1284197 RepID=S8BJP6_DACHA|nr:hypothetical protein H072_6711 [Dactylellina haptotyla CBS 200.50]